MVEAYPLQWPQGWPRTKFPERSKFYEKKQGSWATEVSMTKARAFLLGELNRLNASSVVISSNLELRQDGLPYAGRRRPQDCGVAVYFQLGGSDQCIPCDKWDRPEDNIYAIGKTIEALRGIERWGAKEMVNAAFRGFQSLPSPDQASLRPSNRG